MPVYVLFCIYFADLPVMPVFLLLHLFCNYFRFLCRCFISGFCVDVLFCNYFSGFCVDVGTDVATS